MKRTSDLIRKGYPSIAKALTTGQVNFQDPGLQGDLNRWLSGNRTPGMTPYVSKIASSMGQPYNPTTPAVTPGAATATGTTPGTPKLTAPFLDPTALSSSIGQQFLEGKGTIDLMGLPGTVKAAWKTPPPPVPAATTPATSAATPATGGPTVGDVLGAPAGRPIVGGSAGGEHGTSGLAGYSGIDYFAKAGAPAVAPVAGTVERLSGHDPAKGAVQGAGGPLGWSVYIRGDDGRSYFLTHMGSRNVKPGQRVEQGQQIGTVADYDSHGRASHIHMGVK